MNPYESMIQSCSTPFAPKSAVSRGSARNSTFVSRATSSVGSARSASPSHSRRPAIGSLFSVILTDMIGLPLGGLFVDERANQVTSHPEVGTDHLILR